jgi:hypothetical protein
MEIYFGILPDGLSVFISSMSVGTYLGLGRVCLGFRAVANPRKTPAIPQAYPRMTGLTHYDRGTKTIKAEIRRFCR